MVAVVGGDGGGGDGDGEDGRDDSGDDVCRHDGRIFILTFLELFT